MPRLNLKVVGNHESRCNDSDPRICVRTTMLIFALLKVSYVFKLQDKHNASYFIQNVVQPKGLRLQSYSIIMTYRALADEYFLLLG